MNTLSTFVSSSFLRHEPSGLLNESLDVLCLNLWAVGGFILSFGGFEFNSPTSRPTYLQNLAPLFQAGPLSVIGLCLLNSTQLQKILLPPPFRGFQGLPGASSSSKKSLLVSLSPSNVPLPELSFCVQNWQMPPEKNI